jgi:hypothetical protein
MATALIPSSETADGDDILAAQILASREPGGMVWFLLEHPELSEELFRSLLGMIDSDWYWMFSFLHDTLTVERFGIVMEGMGPCEIISFLFLSADEWRNEEISMAIDKVGPYWMVACLKAIFTCEHWFNDRDLLMKVVQQQVDPCAMVEVLKCFLPKPGQSIYPSAIEWFRIIVERADSKMLVKFLKMYGPMLTDEQFYTVIKYADLHKLALFLKSGFHTLTEIRVPMVMERVDPNGIFPFLGSHYFRPSSTENAEPSSSLRAHPYKREIDKSVIARFSPAQLRIWIDHCDPEQVASYLEASFEENDDVWHDAQFKIFVEMIPSKRLLTFLENNHTKLTLLQFRMVIEELDPDDALFFLDNQLLLPELIDEKRRIAARMAIGWADLNKVISFWEKRPSELPDELFLVIVYRVDLDDASGECILSFSRKFFSKWTDKQFRMLIQAAHQFATTHLEDLINEKLLSDLPNQRFGILMWRNYLVLGRYNWECDRWIPFIEALPKLTDQKQNMFLRIVMDMDVLNDDDEEATNRNMDQLKKVVFFKQLTHEQFRRLIVKKLPDESLRYFLRHPPAELSDEQRYAIAKKIHKKGQNLTVDCAKRAVKNMKIAKDAKDPIVMADYRCLAAFFQRDEAISYASLVQNPIDAMQYDDIAAIYQAMALKEDMKSAKNPVEAAKTMIENVRDERAMVEWRQKNAKDSAEVTRYMAQQLRYLAIEADIQAQTTQNPNEIAQYQQNAANCRATVADPVKLKKAVDMWQQRQSVLQKGSGAIHKGEDTGHK